MSGSEFRKMREGLSYLPYGEKRISMRNEVEHQKFKRGFIILPSPVNFVDILSNGEVENLSPQRRGEKLKAEVFTSALNFIFVELKPDLFTQPINLTNTLFA